MTGWVGVNIAVPVFLPLALLLLGKTLPIGGRMKVMDTLKDAQLCWFALSLMCATLYDLLHDPDPNQRELWGNWALVLLLLLGLFNGFYAGVAAFETPQPEAQGYSGAKTPGSKSLGAAILRFCRVVSTHRYRGFALLPGSRQPIRSAHFVIRDAHA